MLTALRSRLERLRRDDAGITLTELVVSMSLLSIVAALALTAVIGTSGSTDRTTSADIATAQARTTMSSWTNLLQVAVVPDPVQPSARDLAITPTSISFNAQLGNLPSCGDFCTAGATTKVTLQLVALGGTDKAKLVQTLTSGNDTRSLTLVPSGVAPVANGCVFRAFALSGAALGCSTLTSDQTTAVGRVDLEFLLTPSAGSTLTFRTSARLPGGAT